MSQRFPDTLYQWPLHSSNEIINNNYNNRFRVHKRCKNTENAVFDWDNNIAGVPSSEKSPRNERVSVFRHVGRYQTSSARAFLLIKINYFLYIYFFCFTRTRPHYCCGHLFTVFRTTCARWTLLAERNKRRLRSSNRSISTRRKRHDGDDIENDFARLTPRARRINLAPLIRTPHAFLLRD
jgi:hypothetical protein